MITSRGIRKTGWCLAASTIACSAPESLAQVVGWKVSGTQLDSGFGGPLANVGDVDGDGIDDLLIGEPYYDTSSTSFDQGRAHVYSGATGTFIRGYTGGQQDYLLGRALAGVGDVDADGVPDYAIGIPGYSVAGSKYGHDGLARIHSGRTGAVITSLPGPPTSGGLGYSLSRVGDLDGDGRCELIVGTGSGEEAFVIDGGGQVLYHLTNAPNTWTRFGAEVSGCGDVDHDGIDDFMLSERDYDVSAALVDAGRVWVYSGATGTALYSLTGTNAGDHLGDMLCGVGDVDGDGTVDLLCGGLSSFTYGFAGVLRVVRGTDGTTIRETYGDAGWDLFGLSAVDVGDLNGDGFADYGAQKAALGKGGTLRIFSGYDGATLFDYVPPADGRTYFAFGAPTATGNFDGDGILDLVTGDATAQGSGYGVSILYRGCPASWESYGAGWTGSLGVPGLVALEDPGVGQTLDVQLDNSLGADTFALLLLGFANANVPTGAGGTLLVSPALIAPMSVPQSGLTLSAAIPDDPALGFLDVYLQFLEADSGASKGISFTPGLRLRFGFAF